MASRNRSAAVILAAVFLGLLLWPHLGRLLHPSLYADDIVRVAQLRTTPLGAMLFQPFNEHMAPLFQLVSWTTWRLAGRDLTRTPLAFTLASFLPFAMVLPALGLLVRRESGSIAAALVAVAAFSLSWLYIEVAWWYSASSFTWALLGTIAALLAAGRGRPIASALAALAAPAFSAIGLLAGPLAALRTLTEPDRPLRRRLLAAAGPLVGTLSYLGICSVFRYRDVLAENIRRNGDLPAGLIATARAPVEVLLPALLGLKGVGRGIPPTLVLSLSMAGLVATLIWARRSPRRPAILVGLALILGGYGMIYPFRAGENPDELLPVQRYHLFPQAGLLLLLATLAAPRLRRPDARPLGRLAIATAAAALLLATHRAELVSRSRFLRFPDQPATLAALERLAETCRRAGITRAQALAALDPIRPRWFDLGISGPLEMLAPTVAIPGLSDPLVRPTLLATLSPADREALCGGMDATPYLRPTVELAGPSPEPLAVGRLVESYRVRPAGESGHYMAAGWPAYLEFEIPDPRSQIPDGESPMPALEFGIRNRESSISGPPRNARLLSLPASADGGMELWWADGSGRWSVTRRVRWNPDPARPEREWAVPLDRLPHWEMARARRLRVFFRSPGSVAVGEPRLLR